MMRANENPLTPASLAAGGMQGADANAVSAGKAQHTCAEAHALTLALLALDEARAHLQRYGSLTDAPAPGTVEAADQLDAARVMLAQAVTP